MISPTAQYGESSVILQDIQTFSVWIPEWSDYKYVEAGGWGGICIYKNTHFIIAYIHDIYVCVYILCISICKHFMYIYTEKEWISSYLLNNPTSKKNFSLGYWKSSWAAIYSTFVFIGFFFSFQMKTVLLSIIKPLTPWPRWFSEITEERPLWDAE